MAGGRRSVNRAISSRSNLEVRSKQSSNEDRHTLSGTSARVSSSPHLQHVILPDISPSSPSSLMTGCGDDVLFELLLAVFASVSLFVQYLSMYRTVWWLPYSHVNYAMNMYLIDVDVTLFIMVFLCRRLVWCLLRWLVIKLSPRTIMRHVYITFRYMTVMCVLSTLIWLSYRIFIRHHIVHLLYLHYLLVVYVVIFGASADRFLSIVPDYTAFSVASSGSRPVYHVCSSDAHLIREEVEHMKSDFNLRIKQALFNSMALGYYTGVVPMFFSQRWLYFEWRWCVLHTVCVCVCSWSVCVCRCISASYCDTLHRAALHLGHWRKLDTRRTHVALNQWNRDQISTCGVLTKHCRGYYRCNSVTAAAEPGNVHHQRFYFWFGNPALLSCVLVTVHAVCVCILLACVCVSSEWQRLIGSLLHLMFSLPPLYTLTTQCLVSLSVYGAEHRQLTSWLQRKSTATNVTRAQ